jgi:hypothetical protein
MFFYTVCLFCNFVSTVSHGQQYQIEIINRFAALGTLSDDEDINRAWERIRENIKTSAKESLGLHELKRHKSFFDEIS